MGADFQGDIDAVGRITAVPTILDVVCRITGMGFAAVARVTEDRWIACSVRDDINFGLKPGGELKVETTICDEIRDSGQAVVIDHVAEDATYCRHPTPAMYGFQSYISMPIVLPDGTFFGTLCAIDPRPAKVKTPEVIGMFKLFAELIAFHLDAHDKLKTSEASLQGAQADAFVREQFIAVLGHDLRNPLGAIDAGVQILSKTNQDPRSANVIALMRASVSRMAGLIDNVLDFARGRMGEGIKMSRQPNVELEPVLRQVADELRAASPERIVEMTIDLREPVNADPARIGQLFSNLLANALSYGSPDESIRVKAWTHGGLFELSVANAGTVIEPKVLQNLFRPFFRGDVREKQQGLGLGLYISSEIARAHNGTLTASSTPEETRFTLVMAAA